MFLAAQGLATRRPGPARRRQMHAYLQRQGVLQLDSVNVLARAHYLPLFSRHGPYDTAALDDVLWSSGETFEHWGHEASVMPRSLLPALRHRMAEHERRWQRYFEERAAHDWRALTAAVEEELQANGPLTAADLAHLEENPKRKRGSWWDWSSTKEALEYLFRSGRAAVAGRPNFQRLYGAPGRVWGADAAVPGLPAPEARQVLFEKALGAAGIGTVADLADHFRLGTKGAGQLAQTAVERGVARWARVEGWREPALLHEAAHDPRRATGAALLSPFDPACWYRDRLERMFGMEYRIEIYTPAAKRKYGYYTLPFLLGDQLVARVDLKADRKAGALLVKAAWGEERPAPGAKRKPDAQVAAALAAELRLLAEWQGLERVVVEPVGTLAARLAREPVP